MKASIKNLLFILLVSLMGVASFGQELTAETANTIKYGNTDKLEKLISTEQINACLRVGNSKKYGYLAVSIKLKSIKSLAYFIEKGANIEGVCADKTPWRGAAIDGQLEMV